MALLTEKESAESDACSDFAFGDPRGTGGFAHCVSVCE